jgi:hypothetical protein
MVRRVKWVRPLLRVYCPACGEVRGDERYDEPAEYLGSRVIAHYRLNEYREKILCPGGEVNLVDDRAP